MMRILGLDIGEKLISEVVRMGKYGFLDDIQTFA
jgi:hypothetical protein